MKSSFGPTYCRVTLILLCQNDPHRKQCPMEGSEGKPVHPKQIGLSRLTGLLGVRIKTPEGKGFGEQLPEASLGRLLSFSQVGHGVGLGQQGECPLGGEGCASSTGPDD